LLGLLVDEVGLFFLGGDGNVGGSGGEDAQVQFGALAGGVADGGFEDLNSVLQMRNPSLLGLDCLGLFENER
jgi:hypothetical protein